MCEIAAAAGRGATHLHQILKSMGSAAEDIDLVTKPPVEQLMLGCEDLRG